MSGTMAAPEAVWTRRAGDAARGWAALHRGLAAAIAVAALLLAGGLASAARAQEPEEPAPAETPAFADSAQAQADTVPAAKKPGAPPRLPTGPVPLMPAIGAPDSVRTNLWLVQALFGQMVRRIAGSLPPAPAPVALQPMSRAQANPLFQSVADRMLREQGYELFLDESSLDKGQSPAPPLPPGTSVLRFRCEDVKLTYPQSYRRFGLWRQWVDRELTASVIATVIDRDSGRLLFDERLARSYADRVPAGRFASIGSGVYDFTDAPLKERSWRHYVEGVVVIGTLAGLVAIYFANTGG
jgi:hypothetical protein